MPVWDDAKVKRVNRRNAGAGCVFVPPLVTQMNAALLAAVPNAAQNTESTFVLGYWATTNDFYGVGVPVGNRAALAGQLALLPAPYNAAALTHIGRPSNLHAEMAVVQYVVNQHGVAKGVLGPLSICCTGKGCCADCCGWMCRYGIGHGPACNDTGSKQGWKHPLTGATFVGEKDRDFTYYKPGMTGSVTQVQKDPL